MISCSADARSWLGGMVKSSKNFLIVVRCFYGGDMVFLEFTRLRRFTA